MAFIQKNNNFSIKNNQIKLSKDYLDKNKFRFKKITGSRLASVLNLNQYCSEVKAWAMMVNIYSEPMDTMFSDAGNIIEPKIKQFVETKLNKKYISYDPIKIGFDIFKDNKVFGGIPDGEPVDENNNLDYEHSSMLEIKTTSIDAFEFTKKDGTLFVKRDENNLPMLKSKGTKKSKWFDNDEIIVPLEYKFQLGLYCYLRNITKGIFAIGFLEYEDYINPENFICENHDIRIVDFNLNKEEFKKIIDYAENWYNKYIINGISPELSKEDIIWLKENNLYEQ